MPIYDPDHVEYHITSGHIHIVMDDGKQLPAYWAHPQLGVEFPGAVIIHDWWGLTAIIRRIANLFAQMGHYVIAPDLFDGKLAQTPQHAFNLVSQLGEQGFPPINSAISVLETHHQCNAQVAAVGIGMGGSLAYEAAIKRDDLEAAVAYGGFLDRYLGQFKTCNTVIAAFYGEGEPYIKSGQIEKLRKELAQSTLKLPHEVHTIAGLEHEFFSDDFDETRRSLSRNVLKRTFAFLDEHLEGPSHPPVNKVF